MAGHVTYEFGAFRFEPVNLRLLYENRAIPLTAKAADTLLQLVRQPDVVVTKDALMDALWPGVFVDENNLNQQISALRRALAQNGSPAFIETVPRRGYRFVGPVRLLNGAPPASGPTPANVAAPVVNVPSNGSADLAVAAQPSAKRVRRLSGRWLGAIVGVAGLAAGVTLGVRWEQRWQGARGSRAAADRGDELMRAGDPLGAKSAYEQAIKLDPDNAIAYGALAHALHRSTSHTDAPRLAGRSASVEAAARGVAIDPACGVCQGTLGFFLFYHDWRWAEAEAHLREAIRLSPEEESIRPAYALLLAVTGRNAEALEQIDSALAKRPYELGWNIMRASILYVGRRYPEAVAASDAALAIDDRERGPWEWRSRALFQMGRGDEAVKAMAMVTFADRSTELDRAVRAGGGEGGLRALLAMTDDWRGRVAHSWRRAAWRALLHDPEGALDELERACEMRQFNAIYFGVDPAFDELRDTPRFQALLDRMGLADVIRAGARGSASSGSR